MTTICVLFAFAAVLWLFNLAVCAVALLCCCFPGRRRLRLSQSRGELQCRLRPSTPAVRRILQTAR